MPDPAPTTSRPRILLADDEVTLRDVLAQVLTEEGMDVTAVGDGRAAVDRLAADAFDLVISDVKMPGLDGLALLEHVRGHHPGLAVVLLTAYGSVDSAVSAMKLGAADYIVKPVVFDDLLVKVRRLLQLRDLRRENERLRAEVARQGEDREIVGRSRAMQDILRLVDKVARTRSNVLIVGESGTGKELIARAIHQRGVTAAEPFVAVNCGGIPETLFESEMFGHRRGAFTGAVRDKIGFFEAADGGTLFLDEVGNLTPGAQMALLRAIEEKAVVRIGDTRAVRFELRIVSATNRDPAELVAAGKFREDLYFRLNVVQLVLPPLRDRRDDIPYLIQHFIRKYNAEMNRACTGITDDALRALLGRPWKGNIRELENVIERALIFAEDRDITPEDLPFAPPPVEAASPGEGSLADVLRDVERRQIAATLERLGHDKAAAAQALGISLPTLYRKLAEFDLRGG